tara:strand:+ start:692 stop:1471 length:780 start_codon:yes stop_codon:yes gene_type:complete
MTGLSYHVYAQGGGLIITPKKLVFDKNQRIREVILANRGDVEQKYRISLVNKRMTQDGQLTEATEPADGEFFASDVLSFSPRQVVLGPKETQKIRVMSRLRGNSADGEYRSHLLVQEVPEAKPAKDATNSASKGQLGINVQAIFGISIPVILRKGQLEAQVKLENPRLKKNEHGTFLDFDLIRSGNKSIVGTAKAFTGSQEIAILKNVAAYLSVPMRTVSLRIDSAYATDLVGKQIRITFGAEGENEDSPPAEITFSAK